MIKTNISHSVTENTKCGWFGCPGGGDSRKHHHTLPFGVVLDKKERKKEKIKVKFH